MKGFFGFVLFLAALGISCSEKADLSESTKESDSGRVVEVLEMPEGYVPDLKEAAESLGVGIEDLIKCGKSVTLCEGGSIWIYRFDEEGRLTDTLFFRWSDHDQHPGHPNPKLIKEGEKRTMKVYRETVQNRLIRRVELNADEIAHELEEIEKYLIGYLGEEKYRFYYEGGQVDEPDEPDEPEIDDDADPFASEPKVVSAEERRETINRMNHYEAQSIARLIQVYRKEAKEVEASKGKSD